MISPHDLLWGSVEHSTLVDLVDPLRSYIKGLAGRVQFQYGDLNDVLMFRDAVVTFANLGQTNFRWMDSATYDIQPQGAGVIGTSSCFRRMNITLSQVSPQTSHIAASWYQEVVLN
ncbi:hypothetical protein IAT38_002174 [Cryptococcus sp. DSM 104549]